MWPLHPSGLTRRSGLARTPTVALVWQQSDSEDRDVTQRDLSHKVTVPQTLSMVTHSSDSDEGDRGIVRKGQWTSNCGAVSPAGCSAGRSAGCSTEKKDNLSGER